MKTVLKYLFALGALAWLLSGNRLDFSQIRNVIHSPYIFAALTFTFGAIFFASERFRYLLRAQGVEMSMGSCLQLNLVGTFFNFVVPGGVGGDVVKAYYLQKSHSKEASTSPFTVLFDRYVGLYALMMMALVAVCFDYQRFWQNTKLWPLLLLVVSICVAMTSLIALAAMPRVRSLFQRFKLLQWLFASLEHYARQPGLLVKTFCLSVVGHLFAIGVLIVSGLALGMHEVPLSTYFIAGSVGYMVSAMPISPAGIGVGQAAFFFLFNLYMGYESALGPTGVTIFQVMLFVLSLPGMAFYLRRPRVNEKVSVLPIQQSQFHMVMPERTSQPDTHL